MTTLNDTTLYRLDIKVLKQRGSAVIGPDDVRYVQNPAVTHIRFVYDRIIIHHHVNINIYFFCIAVVGVMFVRIFNMTMFNCLKRDKFH